MMKYIKDTFAHRVSERLPRGEFWIGTRIFTEQKIKDDVKAHVAFCIEMGMDFVSIPVAQSESYGSDYHTFNPSGIRNATESGLFVVAVISGPFQRVVDEKGLRQVLIDIAGDTVETHKAIEREAKIVNSLLEASTDNGANAVMIAEDIAFDNGSFFVPSTFRDIFQSLYSEFVENIKRRGAFALFHSCGDITNLIPNIVSLKFDGLSCQMECLDILSLKQTYGTQITLFTGLNRELFDNESLSDRQKQKFNQTVTALSAGGGFVLSSSSGIHSSNMVYKLNGLYCLTDEDGNKPIRTDAF